MRWLSAGARRAAVTGSTSARRACKAGQPRSAASRAICSRTAALLTQFKDFGESNRENYAKSLKWLDRELAGKSFIAGEVYTMADICALCTVDFADWIGLPIGDEFANVKAWHARVTARPSAQA